MTNTAPPTTTTEILQPYYDVPIYKYPCTLQFQDRNLKKRSCVLQSTSDALCRPPMKNIVLPVCTVTPDKSLPSTLVQAAVNYWRALTHCPDEILRSEYVRGVMLDRGIWVHDDDAFECALPDCHATFSFLDRKHHCRRCGHIFCSKHSSNFTLLYRSHDDVSTLKARVCDSCYILGPVSRPVQHPPVRQERARSFNTIIPTTNASLASVSIPIAQIISPNSSSIVTSCMMPPRSREISRGLSSSSSSTASSRASMSPASCATTVEPASPTVAKKAPATSATTHHMVRSSSRCQPKSRQSTPSYKKQSSLFAFQDASTF